MEEERRRDVSTIKKFTDFFAIFGVFSAGIYLITQFMPFETLEETSLLGKVKAFFSPETQKDYRSVLILLLLFLAAFLLSKILPRFSSLNFLASLLPLAWSFYLFDADKLEEHPMLYLISAILAATGSFADCLIADQQDGRRRGAVASLLCSLLTSAVAFAVFLRANALEGIPLEELFFSDRLIGEALENGLSFAPYWRAALMYLLISVIGLLLGRIYFLDMLVSLIPAVFVIVYLSEERLPAFGASLAVLAVACVLCRLALTLTPIPEPDNKTSSTLIKKLSSIRLLKKK